MGKTTWRREGDVMVRESVARFKAVIDFADILKFTEVVIDDEARDPPWEDCDGYEHDEHRMSRIEDCSGWGHNTEQFVKGKQLFVWVPHYNQEDVVHVGNYDRRLITISREQAAAWGIYGHRHGPDYEEVLSPVKKVKIKVPAARGMGQSKQVAREMEAEERRRTLDQLKDWYANGWTYYGVVCGHPAAARHRVGDSLWHIDDEEYADKEVRPDVAYNTAVALQKLGYTVLNMPTGERTKEEKRALLRWRVAYNLGFKKVEDYLRWVSSRCVAVSS